MNVRPPPFNPYMYDNQIPTPNIPTAPPMENATQTIINTEYSMQNHQYPPNYSYNHPTYPPQIYTLYPPPIYTPTPLSYNSNIERYNREEIDRKTRGRQDEFCCVGILAALCCCFMTNVEL